MSSITLKRLPERLHLGYKRRAAANRRSLQAEIIHTLESALDGVASGDETQLDEVAGILSRQGGKVTLRQMQTAIDESVREAWKR